MAKSRNQKERKTKRASLSRKPKTGLISGSDVLNEISKVKKDEWLRFKEMDRSISGRGAEPIYRDKKTGDRISKEEFLKLKEKEKKQDEPKRKESCFEIPRAIPTHSWILRKLDPPPNRYRIIPGKYWDGVDRTYGFEEKMFGRLNEKRALEIEAYLGSASDM